jgi:hypothetical protein
MVLLLLLLPCTRLQAAGDLLDKLLSGEPTTV